MRTAVTQLTNTNAALYRAMRTMRSFSKNERANTAKVAREMVHVTNARKVVADMVAAGVRNAGGTVHAVCRAYSLMSDADDVIDTFTSQGA